MVVAHDMCLGLDAFAHAWPDGSYGFPPITLDDLAVQHALASPGGTTLILPDWPSRAWYPLVRGSERVTVLKLGAASKALSPGPSGFEGLKMGLEEPTWKQLKLLAVHFAPIPPAAGPQ